MSDFDTNDVMTEEITSSGASPEKKKNLVPFIIIGAILVVALVLVLVYNVNAKFKNSVRLLTMSDANYAKTIEKENFKDVSGALADAYAELLDAYTADLNMKSHVDLTLKPGAIPDSGLTEDIAMSADMDMVIADGEYSVKVAGKYQDVSLSLNSVFDMTEMFMQIPEFSDSWLQMPMSEVMGSEFSSFNDIMSNALVSGIAMDGADVDSILGAYSSEFSDYLENFDAEKYLASVDLEEISNRYYGLLVESIDEVSIEKNQAVTVGGVEQKYTVITSKFTAQQAKNFLVKVLEELKNEQVILDVIGDLRIEGLDERAYKAALELVISQLDTQIGTMDSQLLEFKTYVTSEGKIVGRDFYVSEAAEHLRYLVAENGGDSALEFYVKDAEGTYPVLISGNYSVDKDDLLTGNFDFTVNDSYGDSYNLPFTFEKFGDVKVDGMSYPTGKFSFNIPDIGDLGYSMSMLLEYSYDKGPNCNMNFSIDNEPIMEMIMTSETGAAEKLEKPTDYFTMDEVEEYAATFDTSILNQFAAIFGDMGISTEEQYWTEEDGSGGGWTEGWGLDDYSDYEMTYDSGYDMGYLVGEYAASMGMAYDDIYPDLTDYPDYEEGYSDGYADGYYSDDSSINITNTTVETTVVLTTNIAETNSEISQSGETVTTTAVVSDYDGEVYTNDEVSVNLPDGFTAKYDSTYKEISVNDGETFLTITKSSPLKYNSAKEIADIYTALELEVVSQQDNYTFSGKSGYRLDMTEDGNKAIVVYLSNGTNAPYVIQVVGSNMSVLETLLSGVIIQ